MQQHFKTAEENNYQHKILCPVKIFFRNEGEIKTFLDEGRLRKLVISAGGGGLVTKSCPALAIPWTVARQAPLSIGFSRQEYWEGSLKYEGSSENGTNGAKYRIC